MLRLRPPRPDDEAAFLAGHEQMAAEDFTFGLQLEPGMPWQDYLCRLADSTAGVNLPDGWVGSTFLVNAGSIRVIESCGGKLDSVRPARPGTPALRRYWID